MNLIIFLVFLSGFHCQKTKKNLPVFIFPGAGGNQLEAKLNKTTRNHFYCQKKSDWYTIWLSLFRIFARFCSLDNMKLVYNENENRMDNQTGVEIRIVQPFGTIKGLEYIDNMISSLTKYMSPIIKMLEKDFQYENLDDLYGLSYDFRTMGDIREIEIYFQKTKKIIEQTYEKKKMKAILIGHSMGSVLISHFLKKMSQEWKNKHIELWYSINAGFGGTFVSVKASSVGKSFKIPFASNELKYYKEVQSSFPSTYFNFPSSLVFPENTVILSTLLRNYTVKDKFEVVEHISNKNISKLLKYIPEIFIPTPPGVPMVCVMSDEIDTPGETVILGRYQKETKFNKRRGDGTIPFESLYSCTKWINSNPYDIYVIQFPKLGHYSILYSDSLINNLKDFISNRTNSRI